jgi:hypothetical protein
MSVLHFSDQKSLTGLAPLGSVRLAFLCAYSMSMR